MEAEASKTNPALLKSLTENEDLVRHISSELRTLSYLLHPPLLEEMGLETALRWYVDGFGERSNIQTTRSAQRPGQSRKTWKLRYSE